MIVTSITTATYNPILVTIRKGEHYGLGVSMDAITSDFSNGEVLSR